jgi:hypothetical protein
MIETAGINTQMPRNNKRRGKSRPKPYKHKSRGLPMGNMQNSLDRTGSKIYSYTQTLSETTIAQTALTPVLLGGATISNFSPLLSQLDQVSTFTALYDQYRIVRADYRFRPMFKSENFVASTDLTPLIYIVADYDDNTNPASLAVLRQYQNMQTHEFETFNYSIIPHCADALYSGSVFTSFGNVVSPWIDVASTGVVHYGIKIGITAGATGQTNLQRWWVTVSLHVQFRNVR